MNNLITRLITDVQSLEKKKHALPIISFSDSMMSQIREIIPLTDSFLSHCECSERSARAVSAKPTVDEEKNASRAARRGVSMRGKTKISLPLAVSSLSFHPNSDDEMSS